MKKMIPGILFLVSFSSAVSPAQEFGALPQLSTEVVDTFPGGYSVDTADVNGDGRLDIIGLSTNPAAFVWYENPSWEQHIISEETTENIDFAPCDIDHDGRIDVALQSDFRMNRTESGGLVQWLKCPENPYDRWQFFPVWSEPTSHRIRWADFDGDGEMELVNAPLMGVAATSPLWDVGVRLFRFSIPENPEQGPWIPHLIDDTLTVLHGISIEDWDGDGCDDILTASFEGVYLFLTVNSGGDISWEKTRIGDGNQSEPSSRGASEIGSGRINGRAHSYIATIEPWHGNEVVVYTPPSDKGDLWERNVIETGFNSGHGLVSADLNNDGTDEIVAGYRGDDGGLYIYRCADLEGKKWMKSPLDENGITTSDICTVDIDEDGWLDIIAIGAASANIKLYRNRGL